MVIFYFTTLMTPFQKWTATDRKVFNLANIFLKTTRERLKDFRLGNWSFGEEKTFRFFSRLASQMKRSEQQPKTHFSLRKKTSREIPENAQGKHKHCSESRSATSFPFRWDQSLKVGPEPFPNSGHFCQSDWERQKAFHLWRNWAKQVRLEKLRKGQKKATSKEGLWWMIPE